MGYERLNLENGTVLNEDHLKHFEDGIEKASAEKWELINTLSVTEDMGVSEIEISTDAEGTPFDLKEVFVIAKDVVHYGGYAYASVTINGKNIGEVRKKPDVWIHIREKAGLWLAENGVYGYGDSGATSYGFGHISYVHRKSEVPSINRIKLSYTKGEIEIWGVRI